MHRLVSTLLLLGCLIGSLSAAQKTKKLIEFGWDEPNTGFLREHIAEMERAPFDGVVLDADAHPAKGGRARFTWEAWTTNRFENADMQRAIDDLRATKFQRFTDNFLRFNTTPAKLDWFDDYSPVINNCRVAAWTAKQAGLKGLLFDIEQYEGQLFDFRKQRDGKAKGWDAYATKVRERGRELMNAFQSGYPEGVIFLSFGYSLPWGETENGKRPLAECHYGMLAPFLNGMLDAATNGALLVDGNEWAYPFRDTNRIAASYQAMRHDCLKIVTAPEKYPRFFSLSFGIWMDYDWRKIGWETNDFSKNYYSPETFQRSLRTMLETADEYVWVYTEQPRWWTKEGGPVKLPKAYDEAVRAARRGLTRE